MTTQHLTTLAAALTEFRDQTHSTLERDLRGVHHDVVELLDSVMATLAARDKAAAFAALVEKVRALEGVTFEFACQATGADESAVRHAAFVAGLEVRTVNHIARLYRGDK